jgi:hypothetical protein
MPKASKKRKDKAADFAKAKLKLGKGKQLPNNAIDTSFKARCPSSPAYLSPTAERRVSLKKPLLFHHRASLWIRTPQRQARSGSSRSKTSSPISSTTMRTREKVRLFHPNLFVS